MKRALSFSVILLALCVSSLWSAIGMQDAFPGLPFWARSVALIDPFDGTDRLFVVEHDGRISVFENDPGVTTANVFLDITNRVIRIGEAGLVGLAFHPDYENNGYFYVMYVVEHSPEPYKQILSRFTVSANPDSADTLTEQTLIELPKTNFYHVGGRMLFGADGYLYVMIGDDGVPAHGQDRTTMYGSILRIDVDNPAGGKNYGVPADNPYVGNSSGYHEEIWAWGLRNTWGLSIDFDTGIFWGADVGLNSWEEVNVIKKKHNYGWPVLEGPDCYIPDPCDTTGMLLENPIYAYPHPDGLAIIGGHTYRGNRIPGLEGYYVFYDYIFSDFWALSYDGVNPPDVYTIGNLSNGQFYFTCERDKDDNLFFPCSDGRIYQFTGDFTPVTGIDTPELPRAGTLRQNHPNPFNPSTTIGYQIDSRGHVELSVFDVSGRVVRTLVDARQGPGPFSIEWDGRDDSGTLRPSGVYFYRLLVDGEVADTRRMVLLK